MGVVDLLVVIAHNYGDMDARAAKVAIANVYEWYDKIEQKVNNEINRQTVAVTLSKADSPTLNNVVKDE